MTALDIGGVLSIACPFCSAPKGETCGTTDREGVNIFLPRKPHAARAKAAPPIAEAHVGDLVLVRHRGEHVAQLVDIGVVLQVRFWRPSAQTFGAPRLLEREAVIGLAPEDARTAMARAEIDHEKLLADRARNAHLYATDPAVRAAVDAALDFSEPPALASDIAEGRGPFDPGHITSDPSPTTPDAPPDPCFTSDSAPTKALPKGW